MRAERARLQCTHPVLSQREKGPAFARFKQLRYRTYTLERAVEITRGSIERLAAARLYVLLDGRTRPRSSSGWCGR